MCGIVGYIGKNRDPYIGLEALKRLEYRGYDSAGMAFYDARKKCVTVVKSVGRIDGLAEKINGQDIVGGPFIFHTRWATHGVPSIANAHPHADCKKNIWIAHNGIIENYKELKEFLQGKGHHFRSQTDSEVLAHLIEEEDRGNFEEAVRSALGMVRGTYGLLALSKNEPDKLIAARFSSPLLIGIGDNEHIIASDPSAVVAVTQRVVYLDDGDLAVVTPTSFRITTKNKRVRKSRIEELEGNVEVSQKGGYPHFMLKEIYEQPEVLLNALRGRILLEEGNAKLGGLENVKEQLRRISKIQIVACGTAYYAGLVGEYMLEEYAGIPTEVDFASEFRYRKPILDPATVVLCISQSGETADTIAALKEAKEKGALTLGIVNTVGSTIARMTDAGVYNHAGPEIGVASTKAFSSQLSVLALLTVLLGRQRGMSYVIGRRIGRELLRLPILVQKILDQEKDIARIAKKYHQESHALYVGRKYNYPIALEGALKLKEISYIHAEGMPSGELKHGSLALIEKDFPVVAIVPQDSVYEKMVSNIEEVKARGGRVIAFTTEGNRGLSKIVDDVFFVPKTLEMLSPILYVLPLQLFAYYAAVLRGTDVDKPRNLAKSVTVE